MNTYQSWNAKHPKLQYPSSNDLFFNFVSKEQIDNYNTKHAETDGKTKDSFTLYTGYDVSHKFDVSKPAKLFKNINTYSNYDIAEVLRGDYSRLFFDIDIDQGDLDFDEFLLTFDQIKNILSILKIDLSYVGGIVETMKTELKEYLDDFKNLIFLKNPYNTKDFSCHLYVSGYYFSRDTLYSLFSNNSAHRFNKELKSPNHLSKYIDHSVYVKNGAQKMFRFGLSAKLNKGRPSPEFDIETLTHVIKNLHLYVCNRTSYDKIYVAECVEETQNLKNYLETFLTKKIQPRTKDISKKKIKDNLLDRLEDNEKECVKYIAKVSTHAEWHHAMIKQMKIYLIDHPGTTDDDLFNEFIQEKYQYFSNSKQKKLEQPSSVRIAIEKVRNNTFLSLSDIIEIEKEDVNTKDNCFKYTISEFKEIVFKGVSIPELVRLIHYTFIFFTRSDPDKQAIFNIAYLDNKDNIVVKDYDAFIKSLKTTPINIKLFTVEVEKVDRRKKENKNAPFKYVDVVEHIPITLAFEIFDKYKQRFYDFDLYSLDSNIFSLYSNPTTAEPTELPDAVDQILDLFATEDSGDIIQEKKDYILDWLSYVVQHPESRNFTCLQLSTLQGIGKNIISNAISDYLGLFFSEPSKDTNYIIGTYNGGIDHKLFIVMNEVDNSAKNMDKLKPLITEDYIDVNIKYGGNYTGKNHASYLMFTNHLDTKSIPKGDRRYTFIASCAVPKPKEFYESICKKGSASRLKDDIQQQFIKHLLSRDLSNYNPQNCKEFDKQLIYDQRNEHRHPIYNILLTLLCSANYHKDYILKTEFIDVLNKYRTHRLVDKDGKGVSLAKYYNVPELDNYNISEFENKEITSNIISKIMDYESEKEIKSIKSKKRDESRDKWVYKLVDKRYKHTKEEEESEEKLEEQENEGSEENDEKQDISDDDSEYEIL